MIADLLLSFNHLLQVDPETRLKLIQRIEVMVVREVLNDHCKILGHHHVLIDFLILKLFIVPENVERQKKRDHNRDIQGHNYDPESRSLNRKGGIGDFNVRVLTDRLAIDQGLET